MKQLKNIGSAPLGLVANSTWIKDPKRLTFTLSRYKFVSKMLAGQTNVVEVGCGDGWSAKLVAEVVDHLTLTDVDNMFVQDAIVNSTLWNNKPHCLQHDWIHEPLLKSFDGVYCLDVLEHIPPSHEDAFLENIVASCRSNAKVVIGMPSLESQATIPLDRRDPGHVNCKSKDRFMLDLNRYFSALFPFSMNDEVLHTGYGPMSQYLFAVCVV